MKKLFETPELTIHSFDVADVITTSGDDDKTGEFDGEWVPLPF